MSIKVGLCLSGGGARGLAHIGVLKALEKHKIFPRFVSGTSAGSIVGALYAAGKSAEELEKISSETNLFKVFKFGFSVSGLVEHRYLRQILTTNLPKDDFQALPAKLFVCVSNLNTGRWRILKEGSVVDAVVASSSIPLIFEPLQIQDEWYVDGGLLNNFPVEPLVIECDMIIGVNVMPHNIRKEVEGLRNVAERCFDLVVWNNTERRISDCDIAIDIQNIDEYGIFDFQKAEEIIELGYQQTLLHLPKIHQRIADLTLLDDEA